MLPDSKKFNLKSAQDVKEYVHAVLMSVGLWDKGWRFDWNRRTGAFGVCNYKKRRVFLSKFLFPMMCDKEIKDTILHEVAHALTPGAKHGPMWRRKALELGAKPETGRYGTAEMTQAMKSKYNWEVRCKCGNVKKPYQRKPRKYVQRVWHCKVCHGRLFAVKL